MKRDVELVKKILFWMEDQFPSTDLTPERKPEFSSYDEALVQAHCYEMWQAGLIRAADASADDGDSVIPLGITPLGHSFIAQSRNTGAWDKAKQWANSPLGASSLPIFIQTLFQS